jgi:hypothetical protein
MNGPQNEISASRTAIFGSAAIKDALAILQLVEGTSDQTRAGILSNMEGLILHQFSKLGEQAKAEQQALVAGIIGEWATLKAIDQGCGIPTMTSTAAEDTVDGQIDMWAMAGQSEYDGFKDTPELALAIQVKATRVDAPLLIAPRQVEKYAGRFGSSDNTRLQKAADSMLLAEQSYDNVKPLIVVAPNFYNPNAATYYESTGDPSVKFISSVESQMSKFADLQLNGLTLTGHDVNPNRMAYAA